MSMSYCAAGRGVRKSHAVITVVARYRRARFGSRVVIRRQANRVVQRSPYRAQATGVNTARGRYGDAIQRCQRVEDGRFTRVTR